MAIGGVNGAVSAAEDLPVQADVFGLDLHAVAGLGAALDVEVLSGFHAHLRVGGQSVLYVDVLGGVECQLPFGLDSLRLEVALCLRCECAARINVFCSDVALSHKKEWATGDDGAAADLGLALNLGALLGADVVGGDGALGIEVKVLQADDGFGCDAARVGLDAHVLAALDVAAHLQAGGVSQQGTRRCHGVPNGDVLAFEVDGACCDAFSDVDVVTRADQQTTLAVELAANLDFLGGAQSGLATAAQVCADVEVLTVGLHACGVDALLCGDVATRLHGEGTLAVDIASNEGVFLGGGLGLALAGQVCADVEVLAVGLHACGGDAFLCVDVATRLHVEGTLALYIADNEGVFLGGDLG